MHYSYLVDERLPEGVYPIVMTLPCVNKLSWVIAESFQEFLTTAITWAGSVWSSFTTTMKKALPTFCSPVKISVTLALRSYHCAQSLEHETRAAHAGAFCTVAAEVRCAAGYSPLQWMNTKNAFPKEGANSEIINQTYYVGQPIL